ncbi:paramyosin [Wyeomyia smithii]|uniref:paramyosin n=1 Tax=Wyeomyia smithii TaxID=174621 RepID=UPI002467DF22|nr:paramyosin [Wyeomyia smithii]
MATDKAFFSAKTGENHGIFGSKHLKFHRLRDPKWPAGEKMIQYVGMAKLHERNHKLKALKTAIKRKNKQFRARQMRKILKDVTVCLRIAHYGDNQRIKNMFQEHTEFQRVFYPMMIEKIVTEVDEKTLAKRKLLDRLVHQLNSLNQAYEAELIEVSRLQDRTKFTDPQKLHEEIEATNYEVALRNCATRTLTAYNVQRALQEIIKVMLKDSIYYDPVLGALQEDLLEQESFIKSTISAGVPAIKIIQSLQSEFDELEKSTSKELMDRFQILMQQRDILNSNNTRVKTLVRRDSDFDVNPSRYDRDTGSMIDLKSQLEEIEQILKQLKNATSCGKVEEIYPRVKQQDRDNDQMNRTLRRRSHQRKIGEIETELAEIQFSDLINDLTPEEMQRDADFQKLHEKIDKEKQTQKSLLSARKNIADVSTLLDVSFKHILNVLQNVETEDGKNFHGQRSSYISLPLELDASELSQKSSNTSKCSTVIASAKEKIKHLMGLHQADSSREKHPSLEKNYQNIILSEYNEQYMKSMKEVERSLDITVEDPTIFTRKQIKAISAQIVEQNLKRDD